MTSGASHAWALRDWSHRLQRTGARGCLFLAGPLAWSEGLIAALADERGTSPRAIPPDTRIDTVLGQEAELVHQQAHEALDVDLLAAAGGTVRGGGILVVTVPQPEQWCAANDQAVQRHLSYGYEPTAYGNRFLVRLRRLLAEHSEAWLLTPDADPQLPASMAPSPPAAQPDDSDCASPDQAEAIQAVQKLAQGRARRPLVMRADRGRGKSTALGIAAERLLATTPGLRILVTAPQRASAVRLLERVDLRYRAPDELLRHDYAADVLIVDEAAGIPLPVLIRLAQRFPRVVFATTVHGYEGTGRGFALRFDDHLRAANQTPRHITLTQPIRWRVDDPLEAFLARALLLDAEPVAYPAAVAQYTPLDRDALAQDEDQLRAAFGLLVSAHYRTRPTDLRQLLDAPEAGVHAAVDTAGRPAGVALVADEGPLPIALREPIWLGERRVRGHLTPQSLAVHAGDAQAPGLGYRRILRIAVHPARQRQGIGSGLIQCLTATARIKGRDAVSASFGATATLMPFWRTNGLRPVRLGHRRDRASGTHSALVLAPLNNRAAALSDRLRDTLQDQLTHHLPGAFRELEPALIRQLAGDLAPPALGEADWWQIAAFAAGQRSRLDALPALTRLSWSVLTGAMDTYPQDIEVDLLIVAVLQQTSAAEAAEKRGFAGQRDCEQALRRAFQLLAVKEAPPSVGSFIEARTRH